MKGLIEDTWPDSILAQNLQDTAARTDGAPGILVATPRQAAMLANAFDQGLQDEAAPLPDNLTRLPHYDQSAVSLADVAVQPFFFRAADRAAQTSPKRLTAADGSGSPESPLDDATEFLDDLAPALRQTVLLICTAVVLTAVCAGLGLAAWHLFGGMRP